MGDLIPDGEDLPLLTSLTPSSITESFDHLVQAGIVKYDYDFVTTVHHIDGIDFEFRVSKALANKPATPGAPLASGPTVSSPRAGSDINTTGYEVARLGTHVLAFNGFACYRPHFLLLTLDGHRRQWEALDGDDFAAVHEFLESLGGDYMIFFNCRAEAGCSRIHKHLQAIPRESYGGKPWHNFDENGVSLPFEFYEERFDGGGREAWLDAYNRGMRFTEERIGTREDGAPPHNMIMDRGRMVVIPRREAGRGGVAANAGGMLGMIWTSSEELKGRWLDAGPKEVMKVGGYPRGG